MALFRQFDKDKGTVLFTYAGESITPEMRIDDPAQLLEGLGKALEEAYQKIRDTGDSIEIWRKLGRTAHGES